MNAEMRVLKDAPFLSVPRDECGAGRAAFNVAIHVNPRSTVHTILVFEN